MISSPWWAIMVLIFGNREIRAVCVVVLVSDHWNSFSDEAHKDRGPNSNLRGWKIPQNNSQLDKRCIEPGISCSLCPCCKPISPVLRVTSKQRETFPAYYNGATGKAGWPDLGNTKLHTSSTFMQWIIEDLTLWCYENKLDTLDNERGKSILSGCMSAIQRYRQQTLFNVCSMH